MTRARAGGGGRISKYTLLYTRVFDYEFFNVLAFPTHATTGTARSNQRAWRIQSKHRLCIDAHTAIYFYLQYC